MLVSAPCRCFVASHFFLHNDSAAKSAPGMVRSLARQLCQRLPPECGYSSAVQRALVALQQGRPSEAPRQPLQKRFGQHPHQPSEPTLAHCALELWQLLIAEPFWEVHKRQRLRCVRQPVVLLLDALDECDFSAGGVNALQQLLSGFAQLPPWVGLLVTSRPADAVPQLRAALEQHRLVGARPRPRL